MTLVIIVACIGFCIGAYVVSLFRLQALDAMRAQHEQECKNCHKHLEKINSNMSELNSAFNNFDKCYGV